MPAAELLMNDDGDDARISVASVDFYTDISARASSVLALI